MRSRTVGLAVVAVVASITVGVLIGLVIHAGQLERADRPAPGPVGGQGVEVSMTVSSPGAPSLPVNQDDVASTGTRTSDTRTEAVSPPVTDGRGGGPSGVTDLSSSTPATTGGPLTGPSNVPSTTAPTTTGGPVTGSPTGPTSASRTAPTPRPGSDVPDGPCGPLAAKSSTADGTTLFCQHDQTDGSLRWRPVYDGGGCLNQTMTGVGEDGRRYQCTLGSGGLNHWVAAG